MSEPEGKIGLTEVNLGIIPGYGGTQRLPRLIGLSRAAALLRNGKPIGAAEACEWGWAHGEPAGDALSAAKALVRYRSKLELEEMRSLDGYDSQLRRNNS